MGVDTTVEDIVEAMVKMVNEIFAIEKLGELKK